MGRRRRTSAPAEVRPYRAAVLRTDQLSPHWQSVTLAGPSLAAILEKAAG